VTDPGRLSVSLVVFRPDLAVLRVTVASLGAAVERAREAGALAGAVLYLVDNGTVDTASLDRTVADALAPFAGRVSLEILRGHGNVGFGVGHNLAIARADSRYHLVLNPDVVADGAAVEEGVRYLEAHPEVAMIAPHALSETGTRQYLCKRYPSVAILGLRGFGPGWLRRRFRRRLDHYEMRDIADDAPYSPIPIASGCFMLCRTAALVSVGGFSPAFFLYFEDFDLSLRLGRIARIAYVPSVRIVHAGGDAAGKGWAHQRLFVRSALEFFRRHGWRLV
jgi:GT2 family glycosyltransferase